MRGVLASVSLSYPIGTVMMLSTGSRGASSQPRLIQGVAPNGRTPERLILDGQQRLTALYQALLSDRPVKTQDARKNEIRRYYFIDINRALDPTVDREEDAIIALHPDLQTKNFRGEVEHDYSTPWSLMTAASHREPSGRLQDALPPVKFGQVNNHNVRYAVLEPIRNAILFGQLPVGQRLMEAEIADQMGVSRVPVRETLQQLAQEGLVVSYPAAGRQWPLSMRMRSTCSTTSGPS